MSFQSKPRMSVVTMNNDNNKHEAKQIHSNNSNYHTNILTRKGTRIAPKKTSNAKVYERLVFQVQIQSWYFKCKDKLSKQ